MFNHRGTCEADGCGRFWRENCEHCLREVTDRHRAETGHRVHLTITADGESTWELRQMTHRAHQVLMVRKQRWGCGD